MIAVLEAANVKKSYHLGRVVVPALHGVSFDVKENEFLTIFGPSGSGKSTLLHLLGGLDRPDEGHVLIEGTDIFKLDEASLAELRLARIGFVFQFFNLLPRLTALKNVELPLTIAGKPDKEASERAKEMLRLVSLENRESHRPHELSGGEQQRVAIARALVSDPKILLADEPTGNLDTKTGLEIVQLMRKLNKEKLQTFVVITHDQQIAETADRTIYLKDGLIEAIKEAQGRSDS